MVTMKDIIPSDRFIETIFEGPAVRGFPNLETFARAIFQACEEQQCRKVLVNLLEVDYDLSSDSFAEHEFAMSLSQGQARTIQWAILLPGTVPADAVDLVNAIRNPGVRYMAFADRGTAVHWLLNTDFASEP